MHAPVFGLGREFAPEEKFLGAFESDRRLSDATHRFEPECLVEKRLLRPRPMQMADLTG